MDKDYFISQPQKQLDGLNSQEDDPFNPVSTQEKRQILIQFNEDNTTLTIKDGNVVHRRFHFKKQKNSKASTKINTTEQDETIKQHQKIFSFQEYIDKLSHLTLISIENCKVNIYAFKKVVTMNLKTLEHLKIINCSFFENDKIVRSDLQKSSNNNKMLRDINKESTKYEKCAQKTLKEDIELQKKNKLIQEYQCDENSAFIQFELNKRQSLEKKYKKFQNQSEMVNYIIQGPQSSNNNPDQIQDCINQNIIADINENTFIFNKYIKDAFIESQGIILIKQDCLEDPIAQNMINNLIIKVNEEIKTVVFLESGTIPLQCFLFITNSMMQMRNLESIAFIDSWPINGSYYLLKEVVLRESSCLSGKIRKKKELLIVLSRSSFNIAEYEFALFGKEQLTKEIKTTPNYYGFFILNLNQLLEFTPYSEQFIQECLSNQSNNQKHEIEELLIKQKNTYPEKIQQEIKKYQNFHTFDYENNWEQVMGSYLNTAFNENNNYFTFNQQELEKDIKLLLKHYNIYNLQLINKLINYVSNKVTKTLLNQQYNEIQLQGTEITYHLNLFYFFLKDQKWLLQENVNILEGNNFFKFKVENKIQRKNEEFGQEIEFSEILLRFEEIFQNKISNLKGVIFTFGHTKFNCFKVIQLENGQVFQQELLSFGGFSKSDEYGKEGQLRYYTFYLSKQFTELLSELLKKLQKIEIDIGYEFRIGLKTEKKSEDVFETLINLIKDLNINLKWFIINGEIEESGRCYYQDFQINPKSIKKIELKKTDFIECNFLNNYEFETIKMRNSSINPINNIMITKNLRKLKIEDCSLDNYQYLIQNMMQQSQQNSQIKTNQAITLTIRLNKKTENFVGNAPQELEIEEELVSQILSQENINLRLFNLSKKTFKCFFERVIEIQFTKNAIQNLYNIYYNEFKKIINQVRQKKIVKLVQQIPIGNNMKSKQQQYQDFIEFTQFRDIYLNSSQIENFLIACHDRSDQSRTFPINYLEIKQRLSSTQLQYGNKIENDQLSNKIQKDLLFQTSLIYHKFRPKSVRICWFNNLLFSEQLFKDPLALESIEELDFSKSRFFLGSQYTFLDNLINSSPNLIKLNLKSLIIQTFCCFKLNMIKSDRLQTIILSNNDLLVIQPFLKAMSNAINIEFASLDNINLGNSFSTNQFVEIIKNPFEEYIKQIKRIVENNSSHLKQLKISLCRNEEFDIITMCKQLQVLQVSVGQEQLHRIGKLITPSLTKIKIKIPISKIEARYQSFQAGMSQENLQSLLEIARDFKNLNCISLINQNGYGTQFNQYYRELGNESQQCFQILLIDQQLNFVQGQTQKCIRFSEYVDSINQLKFSQSKGKFQIFNLLDIKQFNKIKLKLESLVIWNQPQLNFEFLNQIFAIHKDSLISLQINNCDLRETSFKNVNFKNLPKIIQKLSFHSNRNLTSLSFLDIVFNHIEEYKINKLRVTETNIPFIEIAKYAFYVEDIICDYYHSNFKNDYRFLLEYFYQTVEEQTTVFSILADDRLDMQQDMLYHQISFLPKFNSNNWLKNIPSILSSEELSSSTPEISQLKKLFNKRQPEIIGKNPFLLYLAGIINQSSEYVIGYSRNHSEFIQIQKEQSLDEYILIQKLLENKHDLRKIHLSINLDISYEMLSNQLAQQKLQNNRKELKKEINLIKKQIFGENQSTENTTLLDNQKQLIQKLNKIDDIQKDIQQLNKTAIDELKMAEYLSRIPPCEIKLKNMSVQFMKTWYVINSISPLVCKTTIEDFDSSKIFNSSVANYFASLLPRNSFIRNILESAPHKYRYDETVQFLAGYYEKQIENKYHAILLCLFPIYIFVCIFGVLFFSSHFNISCGNGISWYSYYFYLVYGIIALFIELYMFTKCLSFISHLIPSLEIKLSPGFVVQLSNYIKQLIIDSTLINQWYIGYSYSFFQSQLARFDNFTNVAFLYSTYQCGSYNIFYISLFFICIPLLHSLYEFCQIIFESKKKQIFKLPTSPLDTYYKICNIIEFKAVADILDLVSPSNVTVIRGRMYNSRIISSIVRIGGESIPLVIIQIYNLSQKQMTSSLVLSLILSIITFLTLLANFLMISPSMLNQEDFNKLNNRKQEENVVESYENRLREFQNETFSLKFYDHLKNVRQDYLNIKTSLIQPLNENHREQQQPNQLFKIKRTFQDYQKYFNKIFDSPLQHELQPNIQQ